MVSTRARASAFNFKDELLWDGDYLAAIVAMQSYRSLRRFITRHVAPHADRRIRELLKREAEERAGMLTNDGRALDAWTVALWSYDIELRVHQRLWSRWHPTCAGDAPKVALNKDSMAMEFVVKAPHGRLHVAQAHWLLRHATMANLTHRFARARALARGMAQAHDIELEGELIGLSRLTLFGEVLDGGDLQFTADAEVMQDVLTPRPQREKAERRIAAAEAHQRRLQWLRGLCSGLCLRFSWRDGWTVSASTVPDIAAAVAIKRNRLFAEGRPAFILFATSTGCCARMVDVPLEVLDDQPWMAIDTLRHAYVRYRRQQAGQRQVVAREVQTDNRTSPTKPAEEVIDATADDALVRI
jgi:hypothetical protein